jgi:hypothetical protein
MDCIKVNIRMIFSSAAARLAREEQRGGVQELAEHRDLQHQACRLKPDHQILTPEDRSITPCAFRHSGREVAQSCHQGVPAVCTGYWQYTPEATRRRIQAGCPTPCSLISTTA